MRYIVDGYNLIFRVFESTWQSLEKQRDEVIPFLWELFEGTSHQIDIVFDSNPEHFFTENTRRDPPFHLLSTKELLVPTMSVEEFLSHFRQRKKRQKKEDKSSIIHSAEKLARYRDIFEKRANDPMTFEDL